MDMLSMGSYVRAHITPPSPLDVHKLDLPLFLSTITLSLLSLPVPILHTNNDISKLLSSHSWVTDARNLNS